MEEPSYIKQVQSALRVTGINVTQQNLQLILAIGRKVDEKGEEITLKDITKLQVKIEQKYAQEDIDNHLKEGR